MAAVVCSRHTGCWSLNDSIVQSIDAPCSDGSTAGPDQVEEHDQVLGAGLHACTLRVGRSATSSSA